MKPLLAICALALNAGTALAADPVVIDAEAHFVTVDQTDAAPYAGRVLKMPM